MISTSEVEVVLLSGEVIEDYPDDPRGHSCLMHLHWDAVPAWVCSQCGEPLFETHEVQVIQEALKALDRESGRLLAAADL